MKIYASIELTLEQFLGQDVWVKCLQDGHKECRYIRPLSRSGKGDYLYVNAAYEHVLDYKDPEEIKYEMASIIFIDPKEYQVIEPLTTLRTSDFFPEAADFKYDGALDKYINPDIWVKVFSYSYDFECYINIVSIKDGVITYHVMDANLIDNHYPSDPYNFDEVPTVDDLKWEDFSPVESIKLVKPVELMSTEEMVEALEACANELDDL